MGIGGGREFPAEDSAEVVIQSLSEQYKLSTAIVGSMMERYGRNDGVFTAVAEAGGASPLQSLPSYLLGEIRYHCTQEHVVHLDDLIFRRTTIALEGRASEDLVAEIASIAAPLLSWDESRRAEEIERCNFRLRTNARGVV